MRGHPSDGKLSGVACTERARGVARGVRTWRNRVLLRAGCRAVRFADSSADTAPYFPSLEQVVTEADRLLAPERLERERERPRSPDAAARTAPPRPRAPSPAPPVRPRPTQDPSPVDDSGIGRGGVAENPPSPAPAGSTRPLPPAPTPQRGCQPARTQGAHAAPAFSRPARHDAPATARRPPSTCRSSGTRSRRPPANLPHDRQVSRLAVGERVGGRYRVAASVDRVPEFTFDAGRVLRYARGVGRWWAESRWSPRPE